MYLEMGIKIDKRPEDILALFYSSRYTADSDWMQACTPTSVHDFKQDQFNTELPFQRRQVTYLPS